MNMHSTIQAPFGSRELRDVLGFFATGVAVVTTCGDDDVPVGLAVNSFASVSLDPPEILWSIDSNAPSRSAFEQHGAFAVNVMAQEDKDRALLFAQSCDNKFEHVTWRKGRRGVAILDSAIATLECDVKQIIPSGDHHIILGSVRSIESRDGKPLLFFRGNFVSLGDLV